MPPLSLSPSSYYYLTLFSNTFIQTAMTFAGAMSFISQICISVLISLIYVSILTFCALQCLHINHCSFKLTPAFFSYLAFHNFYQFLRQF